VGVGEWAKIEFCGLLGFAESVKLGFTVAHSMPDCFGPGRCWRSMLRRYKD
jgi:hypothetical protein